jgi:hypothetical protein
VNCQSWGVVTPPVAVGVDRNDTPSNPYGRGGTGLCPGLQLNGPCGLRCVVHKLPGCRRKPPVADGRSQPLIKGAVKAFFQNGGIGPETFSEEVALLRCEGGYRMFHFVQFPHHGRYAKAQLDVVSYSKINH